MEAQTDLSELLKRQETLISEKNTTLEELQKRKFKISWRIGLVSSFVTLLLIFLVFIDVNIYFHVFINFFVSVVTIYGALAYISSILRKKSKEIDDEMNERLEQLPGIEQDDDVLKKKMDVITLYTKKGLCGRA